MSTCKCKLMIGPFLLIALSAMAQQSSPGAASNTAPAESAVPAVGSSQASVPAEPVNMDQVVDRVIERERALMDMLKTRTPLVETYLQNLKLDPNMGPSPAQDHYFFGRMDLGETVDRRDYLSKDGSFQGHLLGGVTKLFKFEYRPMGFAWMIFADAGGSFTPIVDFGQAVPLTAIGCYSTGFFVVGANAIVQINGVTATVLDPTKDVLGNIEEAVAETRALLKRFEEVSMKFAEPMSDDEMNKLLEEQGKLQLALEKRFSRRVRVHAKVDPDLIGGAIVRAGDLTIDGSYKSRLERLAYELTA